MRAWTDDEIRELVRLWPTNSAKQIARHLQRPRSSVSGKAKRLNLDGAQKHFEINPRQPCARPPKMIVPPSPPPRPPPPDDGVLAMQPCSLAELDDTRCKWPLGDIEAVAVLFCGGVAVKGKQYCLYHLRIVRA